jgi:uncharacterized membrane protein YbhN (UPF0104 family)
VAQQTQDRRDTRAGPSWKLWLKLAVSVCAFIALFMFIPLEDVWNRIKTISPALWIGVFFAHIAGHCVAAAKWRSLIGDGIPYFTALRAHFAGLAANLALPGVAGGDLVRAGVMMRTQVTKSDLVLGSLIDRIIDTATLLAIAAAGAAMLGDAGGEGFSWTYLATGILAASGVGGVFLLKPISGVLAGLSAKGKGGKLTGLLAAALERMSRRKLAILLCVIMSIGVQAMFAVLNATLSANIGGPSSIAMWLFAWPLAKLIATLPISIGGLGVREASLSGLFATFGVSAAPVVAASLTWQTIVIAAGLVGALGVIWRRPKTAPEIR